MLAARVPALRPLAPVLRGFSAATRAGYGAVAGNRHRLGPLIPAAAKARADRTIARHRAEHFGLGPPEAPVAASCALPGTANA